jgi:hypothetical protein
MHPDACELTSGRARLRELVLVVGEAEVVPAAVDLEDRPEVLLRHRRALDVPARPAHPPRRLPGGVLARLLSLPEGEVALILLQVARLLRDHLVELRAGEPPVLREARHAEVDVAAGLVGVTTLDQLLDEGDDLRDRLARARLDIGTAEAEVVRVLEEPAGRALGYLAAADALGDRLLVDVVVDVGDVLDERHVVAARLEPALDPDGQHERPRVADVDALVDRRAARVDADRAGRRRKLLDPAGERVIEPHRSAGGSRPWAAPRSRPTARARARRR